MASPCVPQVEAGLSRRSNASGASCEPPGEAAEGGRPRVNRCGKGRGSCGGCQALGKDDSALYNVLPDGVNDAEDPQDLSVMNGLGHFGSGLRRILSSCRAQVLTTDQTRAAGPMRNGRAFRERRRLRSHKAPFYF